MSSASSAPFTRKATFVTVPLAAEARAVSVTLAGASTVVLLAGEERETSGGKLAAAASTASSRASRIMSELEALPW